MTDSTSGPGGSGEGPPADRPTRASARTSRRRVPVWLLIAVPVLLVAALVAFFLTRPGPDGEPPAAQEAPEDVVVTLPPPTPTVEPVARTAGTAFADALPSTVLAYAMTGLAEYPPLLAAGALESYQATYTDGGSDLLVTAGQWATPEAAAAALTALSASAAATGTPEQGSVDVAGAPVGSFVLVEGADGTGSVWWTNSTVLIQVAGPAEALRDVLTAFPL